MTARIAILLAAGVIAACATEAPEENAASLEAAESRADGTVASTEVSETMRVTGSLIYLQRIAMPQDAVASITVFERGPADAAQKEVASEQFALNGRQVPIPFEVVIEADAEAAGKSLTLRAKIDDAEGNLLWTSDTAYPFDLSDGDHAVGEVMLAPSSAVMIDIDDLTGREWMVATMNGAPLHGTSTMTMNFGEDGRLNGSAGCNSYTGSYKLNAGKLTTGPIAMTRKACFGPLMEQEQAFTAILGATPRLSFNGAEALLLRTEDGRTVVAR